MPALWPRRAEAHVPHVLLEIMSATCHADPLSIAAYSTCPDARWHTRIAPLLAAPEMVMFNIGANKGYNLVEFLQRYSETASNLTHATWYSHLVEYGCKAQCCGVCRPCKAQRIPQQAHATRVHLHAFELQPANAALLRRMVAAANIPVSVHSTAVSNTTGVVYTSSMVQPGSESHGLVRTAGKNSVAQPVTTVDAFMKAHQIGHVSFVSIDTEGKRRRLCPPLPHLWTKIPTWHMLALDLAGEDPLVLKGMAQTLADHRVDVVEFEFNRKWKAVLRSPRPMEPIVEWLRQLGYICFWQGNKGALAQISAPCYVEETRNRFGFARSNAVCSHRQDIISVFRSCQRAPFCKPGEA